MEPLIIYEMHVRGFTNDPSSKVEAPGTYLGMIEKIPYLKKLGITAVELMPITSFDSSKGNYWGYAPLSFTNLHASYGSADDLQKLIEALHKSNILVILDLVYNHTGNLIFDKSHYILDPSGNQTNYSGCGNTISANTPEVSKLIIDSLRYFHDTFGVDGFRFDLASTLTRDATGEPIAKPPLIREIAETFPDLILIAEPWDPGGLYQVGSFPHFGHFAEWNGRFRDAVRRYIKGTDGQLTAFAGSICGSEELYGPERLPKHSINFITSHDGFTLRDLVSYQEKHNEANGEDGRDGSDHNESWHCGAEGETNDPRILELRNRQMKNFMIALLTSVGTPMISMGDEYGHTRKGNNNPWCQDNQINYFLWDELEKNRDFFQFVCDLIALRKKYEILHSPNFLRQDQIDWHGTTPHQIDWTKDGRFLARTLKSTNSHLYIAFNMHFEPLEVTLPEGKWEILFDTASAFPKENTFTMKEHSALIAILPRG